MCVRTWYGHLMRQNDDAERMITSCLAADLGSPCILVGSAGFVRRGSRQNFTVTPLRSYETGRPRTGRCAAPKPCCPARHAWAGALADAPSFSTTASTFSQLILGKPTPAGCSPPRGRPGWPLPLFSVVGLQPCWSFLLGEILPKRRCGTVLALPGVAWPAPLPLGKLALKLMTATGAVWCWSGCSAITAERRTHHRVQARSRLELARLWARAPARECESR